MAPADRGPSLQSSKGALGEPQTVETPGKTGPATQLSPRGARGKGLMLPGLSVVVMSLGVGVALPPIPTCRPQGCWDPSRGVKVPEPDVF